MEETKEKRSLRSKFREHIKCLKEFRQSQKEERMALYNGYDSDDESQYVIREFQREVILEEIVKTISCEK